MDGVYTVVGDLHLTNKSQDKATQLFEIVEGLSNPTIWLGDLLDTKEIIRGKCLNSLFQYFKNSKLQHIVIVGNHDFFNLECQDHSLRVLSQLDNVKIVDKTEYINGIAFIPYCHNIETLRNTLDQVKVDNIKTVIGHFDVSGYDYGNGHICESGLSFKDFIGFDSVISGHFHKFQNTGIFTYLGTPFSHSFGEANQDKVIATLDMSTLSLNLIPTPFPRHVSMKLETGKRGALKKLDTFISDNKSNIIRVQLYGTSEECSKIDKSKYADLSIKWEDKSESDIDSGIELDETLDNKTQFLGWAQGIKLLDKETINLGMSILEKLNAK